MALSSVRGMLDVKSLKKLVQNEAVETVLAVFPDMYGRLMGKRFGARFFLEHVLQHRGGDPA